MTSLGYNLFMITVGEILVAERQRKKLTLEQVEKATKIRAKFLVAIEGNQFDKLPPGTFTKGFIKNYAAYLGLPVAQTIAFYRRQVNEDKPVMPTAIADSKNKFPFSFSFTTIITTVLVVSFFIYLIFSYFRYAGSPTLVLSSPAKNAVVNEEQIEIAGKTEPNVVVTINNQEVTTNETGSFITKITLTPGLNTITIKATNKFNRSSTIVRNLRLER